MRQQSPPPLSKVLPSGKLAVLDREYMQRYFGRRLAEWFPGKRIVRLVIKDHSGFEFKKALEYKLTLEDRKTKKRGQQIFRGNIPSFHTTHEARVADQAMRAIWRRHVRTGDLPISRPLGYDERLRMLYYISAPGTPLTRFLRYKDPDMLRWVRDAGRWLAALHREQIPSGRRRSLRQERLEAHYFTLNYQEYYPRCVSRAQNLINTFFAHRERLDRSIRTSSILIHGDYNTNNILVDPEGAGLVVIDFGNAWRYDPMSDIANAFVQIDLLNDIGPKTKSRIQQTLLRTYRAAHPMTRTEQERYHLYVAWWSLQSLSYILALSYEVVRRHKQPIISASLKRAEEALRKI